MTVYRCRLNSSSFTSRAGLVPALSGVVLLAGLLFQPDAGAQDAGRVSDPDGGTQVVYQLQQMRDEIRQLRGMLEQQAHELENIRRRQRDQYQELDQRLNALVRAGPAPDTEASELWGARMDRPDAPAAVSGTAADEAPTPAGDAPAVRPPMEDQRRISSTVQPQIGPAQTIEAPPASEQEAYDRAFTALKSLNYDDAAGRFQDFLEQYPDSDLAPNAQYWLGEAYYASGNFDLALNAFQTVQRQYPDSSKAGDALLKIGYTHYEKQQWKQARAALEQVKVQYAGTSLARLADGRLRAMRLEGHL